MFAGKESTSPEFRSGRLASFGDFLDRSAAGFGVEQHSLVGLEHLLDAGNVGQLRRSATIVEGAKMFVAGEAFAHLQDFDVTVLQFPNLALGEDQSALSCQFHIKGEFRGTPANRRGFYRKARAAQ